MSALYENIRRLSPAAKEHIHAYIINEYIQFKYRGGDINISHVERMGNIAFDSFIAACRDHENFKKTSARDDFVAQLSFESEVFRRVYGLKITSYEEGDFVTIIDIILKTANCDFNPARIAKDALNYHKKELISA